VEAALAWCGQSPQSEGGILHGVTFTRFDPDQRRDLQGLLLSRELMRPTKHTPAWPVTVGATVVWVAPPERRTPGGPVGHGMRFTTLGWTAALALARFLLEQDEDPRRPLHFRGEDSAQAGGERRSRQAR